MKLYRWNDIQKEQLDPLTERRAVHGNKMTVARIELKKGAKVTPHAHENEQVTILLEGTLKLLVGGEAVTMHGGDVLHIPSNVKHEVDVLEDTIVLDAFAPSRSDWPRA